MAARKAPAKSSPLRTSSTWSWTPTARAGLSSPRTCTGPVHDIVLGLFVNRYAFGRAVSIWPSPLLTHYRVCQRHAPQNTAFVLHVHRYRAWVTASQLCNPMWPGINGQSPTFGPTPTIECVAPMLTAGAYAE